MSQFRSGQRVRLSAEGVAMGFGKANPRYNRPTYSGGVVTRVLGVRLIRVIPDGREVAITWHEDFWEPADGDNL